MSRGIANLTKLIMVMTIAIAGGRSSRAADRSGTVEVDAYSAYVSNPQLQPGSSVQDGLGLLSVDGSATAQTDRSRFSVSPRLFLNRYLDQTHLDMTGGGVDLAGQYNFERGQWTMTGSASTDSTVSSELGLSGITNVNRRHEVGTAALGYTFNSSERLSWQAQAVQQLTRYSDAQQFGLTDYNYSSLSLGPSWSFTERVRVSLTISGDRLTPKVGTPQDDYSVSLQLKRNFSEQYGWRISAGETRLAAGAAGSTNLRSFEAGATRYGERVQWDISAKQAVLPIGTGLLTKQIIAALSCSAGTSEHSTLSMAANFIDSYPLALPRGRMYAGAKWVQASVEWRYFFTEHWALSAIYMDGRSRNGQWTEWADSRQARLGVIWRNGRL